MQNPEVYVGIFLNHSPRGVSLSSDVTIQLNLLGRKFQRSSVSFSLPLGRWAAGPPCWLLYEGSGMGAQVFMLAQQELPGCVI